METSYYTPDISEFHVGFEYEQRDPDFQGQSDGKEWKPITEDFGSLMGTMENWRHYQEYRVKCLDRSDIESLGWGITVETSVFHNFRIGQFELSNLKYKLDHIKIYTFPFKWLGDETEKRVVFDGVIRNKSELKKIMQMTGISS